MDENELALLSVDEASSFCRTSKPTWYRLAREGKIPDGLRIGSRLFWRKQDLVEWIQADCPPKEQWNKQRKGKKS